MFTPTRLLAHLVLGLPALAQTPSSVDLTPELPPTATWPIFTDVAAIIGSGGTEWADAGSGRGQLWADIVGPHPTDPLAVGPPDGLLDIVQTNSNSPDLPLGAGAGQVIVGAVGTTSAPSLVLVQQPNGTFQDFAFALIPESNDGFDAAWPGGSPWGISTADFDGDGALDLFYSNGGFNTASVNTLLRADGDGTFQNVTAQAGLVEVQCSTAGVWIDGDLDGDLDLFVTNVHPNATGVYSGPNGVPVPDRYYRNENDGTFTENGLAAGLGLASSGFNATTGDLDLDGVTDIYLCCFKQYNKTYYGRGDGTFAFMLPDGSPAGVLDPTQVLFPDPALPGSLDFVSPPALEPGVVGELALLPSWSMPIACTDVNGDGWLDIVGAAWSNQMGDNNDEGALGALFAPAEPSRVYLNRGDRDGDGRGDGLFRDVTFETGLDLTGGVMGMAYGDFNGDGFQDFYLGAGGPTPIEHLEEDYTFINEPSAWPLDFQADPDQPLGKAFYELGALTGSYANKLMTHGINARRGPLGNIDVVIGNGGPAVFNEGQANVYYQNQGNAGPGPSGIVEVRLEAPNQPLAGLGARVELVRDGATVGPRVLARQRTSSQNFSSQYAGPLEIGTGGSELAYAGVRWPDGRRSGRVLWPFNGGGDAYTFEPPSVSVSLDAVPTGGGALRAVARVENHGTTASDGRLQLAWLLPDAGADLQLGGALVILPDLVLAPGASWELVLPLPAPGLPTGLWALRYIDDVGGLIGEGAAWVEAPSLPASLPATDADPGPGVMTTTGPGPERLMLVRDSLRVPAAAVRLVEHRLDGAELAHLDGSGGSLELAGYGRVQLHEGVAELQLGLDAPLALTVRPDVVTLYFDIPTGCCDIAPPELGKRVEFHIPDGGFWLVVDERSIPRPESR